MSIVRLQTGFDACRVYVNGRKPATAEKATMKNEMKFQKSKPAIRIGPKIKTLDVRISIANHDLQDEVRRAFDLAKSSGQELNLSFSHGIA